MGTGYSPLDLHPPSKAGLYGFFFFSISVQFLDKRNCCIYALQMKKLKTKQVHSGKQID